jgi:prepilin-type N-terminal cleavage/methylation domain-containing protein
MEIRSKVPRTLPVRQKGFTLTEVLFVLAILGVLLAAAGFFYSGYKTKVSETVVQEDLRQAYTSAMAFFIDFPQRALTRVDLEKYGFRASPQIETRVVDGRLASLLLVSYCTLPGSKVFMVEGLRRV